MIGHSSCLKITILGEANGPDPRDQYSFEWAVSSVLDGIAKTRVGRVVLDEIGRRPHQVTIIPFRDTEPANAFSAPVFASDKPKDIFATVAARTREGSQVLIPDNSKFNVCKDKPIVANGKPLIGTGRGTEEVVNFTPRHWVGQGRRITPEVALVHELTHSLRAVSGTTQRKSSCNAYDNQEEFFAILVENLFRSECIKNGQDLMLRWHHTGITEMPPKLADPKFFFQFHKQRVWQLMREMPSFATKLMDVRDIAFNPLASKNQLN